MRNRRAIWPSLTRSKPPTLTPWRPRSFPPTIRRARTRPAVVYFIDRALMTFLRGSQPVYTQGLKDLQAKTKELFPSAGRFSALTSAQQIQLLTAIEKTPFFTTVRTHTITGMFASPTHGGNYNKAGWKLIGFEDTLNFKPPFGYYDATAAKPAAIGRGGAHNETISAIDRS